MKVTVEVQNGWWATLLESSSGAGSYDASLTYWGDGQSQSDSTWGDSSSGGESHFEYDWSWYEQSKSHSGWSDGLDADAAVGRDAADVGLGRLDVRVAGQSGVQHQRERIGQFLAVEFVLQPDGLMELRVRAQS